MTRHDLLLQAAKDNAAAQVNKEARQDYRPIEDIPGSKVSSQRPIEPDDGKPSGNPASAAPPIAYLVHTKSPGKRREFATLPGYVLEPDEMLVLEIPLFTTVQPQPTETTGNGTERELPEGPPFPPYTQESSRIDDDWIDYSHDLRAAAVAMKVKNEELKTQLNSYRAGIETSFWRNRAEKAEAALAAAQGAHETTLIPPRTYDMPFSWKKMEDAYYDGATAYRNALKAAIDAAKEQGK